MLKLKEDRITYNVPTSWDNVTIGEFNKCIQYINKVADIEGYPDDMIYENLFEIFTGSKGFKMLSLVNALNFMSAISFILTEKISTEPYKNELILNGLIVRVKDFEKFNYSEFIDTQQLLSKGTDVDTIKNIAMICDFYEPRNIFKLKFKVKKLNYNLDTKIELINKLPAKKFRAINDFFLRGQEQFVTNMVSSMEVMVKRLVTKARLAVVGAIISGLWMRVKKILPNLKKLLVNRSER